MSQGEQNFEDLHFEPAPALDGEVPGPRSRAMLAEQDELESSARSYPRSVPVAIEEGRGATMRDVDGNTFIDFFGGAGVLNVGHSHPAVMRAASEQQQKLVHALDFPTTPEAALDAQAQARCCPERCATAPASTSAAPPDRTRSSPR